MKKIKKNILKRMIRLTINFKQWINFRKFIKKHEKQSIEKSNRQDRYSIN